MKKCSRDAASSQTPWERDLKVRCHNRITWPVAEKFENRLLGPTKISHMSQAAHRKPQSLTLLLLRLLFWTIFGINSDPKTVESGSAAFANQGGDTLSNFTGDCHAVDSVENGLGKLGYASQDQWFG